MYISEETVKQIKDAADILDVCQAFMPDLKRVGQNYVGLSPKTAEKTPSFHVIPAKNRYKDFSNTKKEETWGDPIRFLMMYQQMSYPDALKWLADRYGIPIKRKITKTTPQIIDARTQMLYEANEWACKMFERWLQNKGNGSRGLDYLQVRGVSDELIKKFRLGYSINSFNALLSSAKSDTTFTNANLVDAGLVNQKAKGPGTYYYDTFRDRVMFPITDSQGRVIAFGGRQLPEDIPGPKHLRPPKYINSHESHIFKKGSTFFGLHQAIPHIRAKNKVYLVEGYMDVLAFWSAGIYNVVSLNGTAMRESAMKLLGRYTRNFVVVMDGDAAGQKAAEYILPLLLKISGDEGSVSIVNLPDNEDPDEYIGRHGKESFIDFIENKGVNFVDAVINSEWSRYKDNPEKSAKTLDRLIVTIMYIESRTKRNLYFQKLASVTGVPIDVIIKESVRLEKKRELAMAEHLNKMARLRTPKNPPVQPQNTAPPPIPAISPYETVAKVLVKFGHLPFVPGSNITLSQHIIESIEEFSVNIKDAELNKILHAIATLLDQGQSPTASNIITYFPEHEDYIKKAQNARIKIIETFYRRTTNVAMDKLLNQLMPDVIEHMINTAPDARIKESLISAKKTYPEYS